MNSFKRVRAFQILLEFGSVGFWEGGGGGETGVPEQKPVGAKERSNNNLNPHMASTPGFEPGSPLRHPRDYWTLSWKPSTISKPGRSDSKRFGVLDCADIRRANETIVREYHSIYLRENGRYVQKWHSLAKMAKIHLCWANILMK